MITYQPSTKAMRPVPPEFAENFRRGGWRLVERLYGARTDQIINWIERSGCRKTAVKSPLTEV